MRFSSIARVIVIALFVIDLLLIAAGLFKDGGPVRDVLAHLGLPQTVETAKKEEAPAQEHGVQGEDDNLAGGRGTGAGEEGAADETVAVTPEQPDSGARDARNESEAARSRDEGFTTETAEEPPPPPPPSTERPRAAPGAETAAPAAPAAPSAASEALRLKTIDVLFGTDRKHDGRAILDARGDRLLLGEAKVSVPPNHTPGVIERPLTVFNVRLETEDPRVHFTLESPPQLLSESQFRARIAAHAPGNALLFVHGYNTGFSDGLFRTAQVAHDLNFLGPVFYYSWPSKKRFFDYGADNQSVSNTLVQGYFRDFVTIIAQKAKVKNLTIVAHSKGNELVLQTLAAMAREERAKMAGCCSHLILASPDVDRDVATQLIKTVTPIMGDITLYANASDIPLAISACINSGLLNCNVPRLGALLDDRAPVIVSPMDSIDVSGAAFDLLGLNHNTYVYDEVLRGDLQKLIEGLRPPDRRTARFKRREIPRGVYWRLEP